MSSSLSFFSLILIVPHRRVFMFQYSKSITWWRVPSSSSATAWVFSKDSRWLRILLLRPICTFPLLITVLWYIYSITHAPAALDSIFRRKCLNKLFMLVAIENERPFPVSLHSLVLISLQYSILEVNVEASYGGAVKITFSSKWMMKVLSKTEQCLYSRYSELSIFQFSVVTLNVILGLGNWMGSIIVATFSGITSTLRISTEIVKLNFREVRTW